eukprot:1187131-Prorocentrum_minimum.AAC.1
MRELSDDVRVELLRISAGICARITGRAHGRPVTAINLPALWVHRCSMFAGYTGWASPLDPGRTAVTIMHIPKLFEVADMKCATSRSVGHNPNN